VKAKLSPEELVAKLTRLANDRRYSATFIGAVVRSHLEEREPNNGRGSDDA
jgi:hypothetical protein